MDPIWAAPLLALVVGVVALVGVARRIDAELDEVVAGLERLDGARQDLAGAIAEIAAVTDRTPGRGPSSRHQ